MNLALWIVASVLAASFAGSGLMKTPCSQGQARQLRPRLGAGRHSTNIRLIGVVEVLGAAGLICPQSHISPLSLSRWLRSAWSS